MMAVTGAVFKQRGIVVRAADDQVALPYVDESDFKKQQLARARPADAAFDRGAIRSSKTSLRDLDPAGETRAVNDQVGQCGRRRAGSPGYRDCQGTPDDTPALKNREFFHEPHKTAPAPGAQWSTNLSRSWFKPAVEFGPADTVQAFQNITGWTP